MASYIMSKNGERVLARDEGERDALIAKGYVVETDSEHDPRDKDVATFNDLAARAAALTSKETLALTPLAAPPAGPNAVGELYVTDAGVLRVCTAAGSPGTWVSVGSQV